MAELRVFPSDVLLVLALAQVSVTDMFIVPLCLVSARGPPTVRRCEQGELGRKTRDQDCRELVMCPRAELLCSGPRTQRKTQGLWLEVSLWRAAEAPALRGSRVFRPFVFSGLFVLALSLRSD